MCRKARQNKMLGPSHKVSNFDTIIRQYAYIPSNKHKSMIINVN